MGRRGFRTRTLTTTAFCFVVIGAAVSIATGVVAQAGAETPLRDKTLVVWTAPANLDQRAGSALTIDDMRSHFDAIVLGDPAPKKWTPSSDNYRRTHREQSDWQEETVDPKTFVQVAIVYEGRQVIVYRNGQKYAQYEMAAPPQEFGPQSVVVFGMRHLEQGDDAHFAGAIDDARIYDVALSAGQIKALHSNELSNPKPWAWWTFDGKPEDLAGRFVAAKLVGGAAIKGGRLVLDGRTGSMFAARSVQAVETAALAAKPLRKSDIEAARRLRHRLLSDPYRPGYHFVVPESVSAPLDPNGVIFFKGRYHLFYLYGPGGRVWAHASSRDLVHWRHHPHALAPSESYEGGYCWSGDSFVHGDAVAILYWGKGGCTCLATSADDDLTHWTKHPANPVIPAQPPEGSRPENHGVWQWRPGGKWYGDKAACAWKEGDNWYCVRGGMIPGKGDTVFLFKSPDLIHWRYLHPFYESERKWTYPDDDNACPDFFKLGHKHMLLFISHKRGCQYYLGRYENERFHPETHGKMSWADNAFFAPDSLLDDKGRRIMWAWIFDGRSGPVRNASGWSGTMSLPRVLSVGDDGTLRIRPVEELEHLRYDEQAFENLGVATNQEMVLEKVAGNSIELLIEMRPQGARQCGVRICRSPDGREQTGVYYDTVEKKLKIDVTRASLGQGPKNVEAAPLELRDGETLTLHVFVDKSVVEAFANDRQAAMRRIYPTRAESAGVSLFSQGGPTKVRQMKAWKIMPANPY